MVRIIYMVMLMASLSAIVSCSTGKAAPQDSSLTVKADVPVLNVSPQAAMPKAVIYKMNGDYASLVPVTLDPSGRRLMSFPAPTDLTEASRPLAIANGWYLDRRGCVGLNTAVLKYTYEQYMALKSVPTPSALMADIVPGAKVTQVKVLPMTLNAALSDTASIKQYAE